jgi:predicted HTH domain antitoxin
MVATFVEQRIAQLNTRLAALESNVERARRAVERLENEPVPAGATAQARAARLAAARAMAATLELRERQVRVALSALQAEIAE